jgi:hypothetical protein
MTLVLWSRELKFILKIHWKILPTDFMGIMGLKNSWIYSLVQERNLDIQYWLHIIYSEEDYDAYYLAYILTYWDFEGGTLGLAWIGHLINAGGVCEKNGVNLEIFKLENISQGNEPQHSQLNTILILLFHLIYEE